MECVIPLLHGIMAHLLPKLPLVPMVDYEPETCNKEVFVPTCSFSNMIRKDF